MLEAADASRTLMSHSDHPHEVPSQEKGVNPQQHAVLPGDGSVQTEKRVGTEHEWRWPVHIIYRPYTYIYIYIYMELDELVS